jgi:GAF domain-containing protein/HAMP domain-containing protein
MNTNSQTTPQKRRRFRASLAWNMMALLLPITIIPTLLMGITVYNRGRNLLLQQISQRMDIFLSEAIKQMDSWFTDKNLALLSISSNMEFITTIDNYLEATPEDAAYEDLHNRALAQMRALNPVGQETLFNHLLFLDIDGQIRVSTTRSWEGETLADQAYFQKKINIGELSHFFEFSPYLIYHPDALPENETVIFSSIPIKDRTNTLLGYLVGVSSKRVIQSTIEANRSFLPENKFFLVDLIDDSLQFAGMTDFTKSDSLTEIQPSQDQINQTYTLQGEVPNAISYTSFEGSTVLGIYRIYDTLNLGFLVEVPEESVLGEINTLAPIAIGLMVGTTVLISVLIFWASRRITNPLGELSRTALLFSEGDWKARSTVNRQDEIGALSSTFNTMANDLMDLYQEMENQVEVRTRQVITATEVSSLATGSANLDELLDQTVVLISDRFNFFHIAIYLLDSSKEIGQLRAATSAEGRNLIRQGHRIRIVPNSIYQWVIRNNQPRTVNLRDMSQEDLNYDALPEAQSKIALPISVGTDVFGVIDIQSKEVELTLQSTKDVLVTLANQLASAIQNFRLREGAQIDMQQVSQLYQASQAVSQSTSIESLFSAVATGVQHTSFFAAVYRPEGDSFRLVQPESNKPYYAEQLPHTLQVSASAASMFFETDSPVIIRNLIHPSISIRPELLEPAKILNAHEAAYLPIFVSEKLAGFITLASRETGTLNIQSLQPFIAFGNLVNSSYSKIQALEISNKKLDKLEVLTSFSNKIINETDPDRLYSSIHEQMKENIGDVDLFIALYDPETNHIEIPYLYEGDQPLKIDPFPLGDGLTSIVVRSRQPLLLVENTEERAKALGAKIVGQPAKSWMGLPLIVGDEVIGIISLQDVEQEKRFDMDDLDLLQTLAPPIAGAIRSSKLLSESMKRSYQLQTSAEISRETSTTLDQDELLSHSIKLIQDRFNFYHASVFLIDPSGEYAYVQESTGKAGRKMKTEGHRLKIGSQSVIGYVTQNKLPLVVNDVTQDPTHKFNPLLPDTRAELGLPILLGDRLLGALDVQSTTPYTFSPDDIEVLQILANQLAVAINNADLFMQTQEHLAQHRLIHHVTTVAASSTTIDDALSSAVQALRVTLGDNVSILMLDKKTNTLKVQAASGYKNSILGMTIAVGEGITGWVAENNEALIVNNVRRDSRYLKGKEEIESELAVPLIYRGELLGVLNIESEIPSAFDEHDMDILGTLAGSLAAIIVNARLSQRQQKLFEITSKIRQSVKMDTIIQTTAEELTKALQTRRTKIQVGGQLASEQTETNGNNGPGENFSGKEGDS